MGVETCAGFSACCPAGAPFWAHVVSTDLAHWTWLPPALLPDTVYDFNGVWSGAATVPEETGIPVLTYTGELLTAGAFILAGEVVLPHT
jgi:sucrose-6-phosphate hydrolase SacC (GH32 family)